jgi:glyoxylase I family protein
MRVEHVAFNVEEPLEMARWYVENLGFVVKRRVMEAPWAHFIVDSSGSTMIEIYGNPDVSLSDFRNMHPGTLHLAFVSEDIQSDIDRLSAAGAKLEVGITDLPGGDIMAFIRDPWGLTLQLVKRRESMI